MPAEGGKKPRRVLVARRQVNTLCQRDQRLIVIAQGKEFHDRQLVPLQRIPEVLRLSGAERLAGRAVVPTAGRGSPAGPRTLPAIPRPARRCRPRPAGRRVWRLREAAAGQTRHPAHPPHGPRAGGTPSEAARLRSGVCCPEQAGAVPGFDAAAGNRGELPPPPGLRKGCDHRPGQVGWPDGVGGDGHVGWARRE